MSARSNPCFLNEFLLVIIDVELSLGIDRPGGLKGNADKVLAEDVVEHTLSQGAILVEDLIHHVLRSSVMARDRSCRYSDASHTHA